MSGATTTSSPTLARAENAAVSAANDVPTLIAGLKAVDSPLADQLQAKSLIGSKTFWAPIVTHAVTWAVGYWGLQWDAATTEAVAGLISWALMVAARYVARSPIGSILPATK